MQCPQGCRPFADTCSTAHTWASCSSSPLPARAAFAALSTAPCTSAEELSRVWAQPRLSAELGAENQPVSLPSWQMLTFIMLARLSVLCPSAVLQRLERLIEPLRATCSTKVRAALRALPLLLAFSLSAAEQHFPHSHSWKILCWSLLLCWFCACTGFSKCQLKTGLWICR